MNTEHDSQTSRLYKENWDDAVRLLNEKDARIRELQNMVGTHEFNATQAAQDWIAKDNELDRAMERIGWMQHALHKCVEAMKMQNGRELGEMHINQPTALKIWTDALDAAKPYL